MACLPFCAMCDFLRQSIKNVNDGHDERQDLLVGADGEQLVLHRLLRSQTGKEAVRFTILLSYFAFPLLFVAVKHVMMDERKEKDEKRSLAKHSIRGKRHP